MQHRRIPRSGASVPVIGMGTWQTFDPQSLDASALDPLARVLKTFHAGGGRVVDSSPMYGKAEEVVGRLADRLGIGGELFLATKVWTPGEEEGIAQMTTSLERLRRDRIELMQIHNLVDWRVQLATLRRWKEEGRIEYLGVTHYLPSAFPELERILRTEQVDFIQLPYSIGRREAEARLLPAARDTGTAVLVMRPLEVGGLPQRARGQELPELVRAFASTWAEACLKWVLAHPDVTCVLPATSKVEHMVENLDAGEGRLPDATERRQLLEILGV